MFNHSKPLPEKWRRSADAWKNYEVMLNMSFDIKALKAAGKAAMNYYDAKNNKDRADAAYDTCHDAADEIIRLTRERDAAYKWIQEYTESIDLPCIACKHYTGRPVCKPICGGCGRIGKPNNKWEFGG